MVFNLLKINGELFLFTSDLHLLHNNIHKYEAKKRNILNTMFNIKTNPIKEPIKYNVEFFNNYFSLMQELIKKYNIKHFYNLGDFIFNVDENKINTLIKQWIKPNLTKKMNLIIWNHDINLNNIKTNNLNNDNNNNSSIILDSMEHYVISKVNSIYNDNGIELNSALYKIILDKKENVIYIISHHPVIKNIWNHYKWFWKKENDKLLHLYNNFDKKLKVINIHWHTHSKTIDKKEQINWIQYMNVCIDNL